MNLFEKLNRLDDSLVESKRVVKKNKLTEDSNGVTSQLPDDTDIFLQDLAQMYGMFDYKDIMNHKYTEEEIKKLRNYERRFNAEIEYEGDEEADAIMRDIAEKVAKLVKNNTITENRNNPYFAPYGYKDAVKVLNGKAPEYYYYLKEIEMDMGDGVKLARYAMRKGLPVMVNKNSDPDYPEFAIKGEYHWNDYFYPYPTAHKEDFIPWDGKMFTEQSLTEGDATKTYKYPSGSPVFKFDKFLENTKEDFITVAPSISKAKSNIESQIKSKLRMTQNTSIKIDETKIVELKPANKHNPKSTNQQMAPEQLSMKF